ncbi:PREDICTED: uncharacterized protein LOC108565687 isoform X2 [Nicrophorus vespilloides]|uniref:Uncharacterized protein LOC108565687 isoform X2 n=1 Tax=Nicrophorus vespilloides TaxID=110193 RepID=A0ABM1N1Q6_NICVS|nr:PREDICTED: uncharacterized protein LOC108565687 isoform X2 [Nicrophorus vespilloides]
MLGSIVPRLIKMYNELMKSNEQQLNSTALIKEKMDIETALNLIYVCEKLIIFGEQEELIKLNKTVNDLRTFRSTIKKFKSFHCECEETMRYIRLLCKAGMGLDNKLPELEENIEVVSWDVRKTIRSIIALHKQPDDADLKIEKKTNISELLETLEINAVQYDRFETRLEHLINYLKMKLKISENGLTYVHEADECLRGKNDKFLRDGGSEVNKKLKEGFVESTSPNQEVLGNSLKEVMKMRRFTFDKDEKTGKIEVKETKETQDLMKLHNYVLDIDQYIRVFQNLKKYTKLRKLQTADVDLQQLKMELCQVQG